MVPWNFDTEEFKLYQDAIDKGKIAWCGNWEMWKPQGLPANLKYIPQVRTAKEANQIGAYLDGYHAEGNLHSFVGFNEPDINSQADMCVKDAVELWQQYVLPVKQKHPDYVQGSPAISNGPNGIPWLKEFIQQLGGLDNSKIDVIVLHYYSPNVRHFKQYVHEAYATFQRPIWINEFACTTFNPAESPSEAQVASFMKEALSFVEYAPFVERYAWFGAMKEVSPEVGSANGLEKDGQLSEAGRIYTTF